IHGVAQERIIKSDVEVRNGVMKIKSKFTVLLSDHNIPIPRVVKEKLANEIKVEIMAELIQK
ncbi:MAG: YceI family protein, partial [Chitinophagaceae bacterium]